MKIFKARSLISSIWCCILAFMFLYFLLVEMNPKKCRKGVQRCARKSQDFLNMHLMVKSTPPQLPSASHKCQVNDSLLNIPKNIPEVHRVFLRYKHCRSFPRLLTPRACDDNLFLLMAIKSTAAQVDRRVVLRNTWGQEGVIRGKKVKLVFLLGRSQDKVRGYPLQQLLKYENKQYGDILQWDFVDSFFNLTLKEVHFLSWFSQECQTAQFVLKGDDDVFIHTGNIVEFLEGHNSSDHLFVGDIISRAQPVRDHQNKYFIPVQMYPLHVYPPYAGGGGYLMSHQTVIHLHHVAQDTDLFPIDDVFVGMCLQKIKIRMTFHNGFKTFGYRQNITPFNPCIYKELMLVHKLTPTEIWTMWSLVDDPNSICHRKAVRL